MSSQQSQQQSMMSKNDIIAKYMKSIGQTQGVQSNQIPTTKPKQAGAFTSSQYNNYIKQGQQPATASGHSRNYNN